jgi:hypothetical protein
MRKAGDLLSAIIDEKMMQQAQGYSKVFYSWARTTARHGIAAAADHSRIRELERNVVLVEADHPGWIQILQTKNHKVLADLQAQFPDMALTGISFRLSRNPAAAPAAAETPEVPDSVGEDAAAESAAPPELPPVDKKAAYERIRDEGLRKTLESLERSIRGRRGRE